MRLHRWHCPRYASTCMCGKIIRGPYKKKPFAFITECICCGIVSRQPHAMSQHLFPSRVAFIFGRHFVLMTGESNHFFSLFQHIPKTFNGVKVTTGQLMCENYSSCSLTLLCVLMLHSFTTRDWWIWALLSWNMPEPSGKKKSIDGITW